MKLPKWHGWHLVEEPLDVTLERKRQKTSKRNRGLSGQTYGAAGPMRTLTGEELAKRRAELEAADAPDSLRRK